MRLRDSLDSRLLTETASYGDTVKRAQASLEPAELVLDAECRRVRCGATLLTLPPIDFAFLAWFARRALTGLPGICRARISDEDAAAFLAEYEALYGEMDQEVDRPEALRHGMDEAYFDSRRSRLHEKLTRALRKAGARPYLIESDRRRPLSRYALALKPSQVRFEKVEP